MWVVYVTVTFLMPVKDVCSMRLPLKPLMWLANTPRYIFICWEAVKCNIIDVDSWPPSSIDHLVHTEQLCGLVALAAIGYCIIAV